MNEVFDVTVSKRTMNETNKGMSWKVTLMNKDLGHSLTLSLDELEIRSYPIGAVHHVCLKNPQTTFEELKKEADEEIVKHDGVPVLINVENENMEEKDEEISDEDGEDDDGEDDKE